MDWRQVVGFDRYEINDKGDIRKGDKPMKVVLTHSGYHRITLTRTDGTRKSLLVHRIVAMAFIPNRRSKKLLINHINGVRTDNRLENLEWVTSSENSLHRYRNKVS
jgi:hypothetical protein